MNMDELDEDELLYVTVMMRRLGLRKIRRSVRIMLRTCTRVYAADRVSFAFFQGIECSEGTPNHHHNTLHLVPQSSSSSSFISSSPSSDPSVYPSSAFSIPEYSS